MSAPSRRNGPVQRFLHAEAAGGIVLTIAAAVALIWANSPWGGAYDDLWGAYVVFDLNFIVVREDLRHLVNDGAMTLFFFVVGLEIKREVLHGELASRRRAALPVAAAIGGMAVPALLYSALNAGGDGANGWGIPMATDIAFAVGVLALAGPRVPASLKVFLLALAIVDDLGAIAVIAIFYTGSISAEALIWGGAVAAGVVIARIAGIRNILFYVIPGVLFWLAVLESGVHATIAGVILAFLTPAGPVRSRDEYHARLRELVLALDEARSRADREAQDAITTEIDYLTDEREPPLDRIERALHPWSSFAIVPLFALANAGLDLSAGFFGNLAGSAIGVGVVVGLVVGKPVGIVLLSWLAVRSGLADLPPGVSWRDIAATGMLAGIGFTVALFIASLAFDSPQQEEDAKAGILVASLVAGLVGFLAIRSGQRGNPA